MFDWMTGALGASPWTYALIAAIVAGDAVFPIFPGEAAVIAGGVLAAGAQLSVALVVAAAMAGAAVGDNGGYAIGRAVGGRAAARLVRGAKARRRLRWSERQLQRRGAHIVVVARFVPGGRTATTVTAGSLAMRWPRFLVADLVAAVLWSGYATSLGYFGGSAFRDSLWKPLAVSLAVGLVMAALGELYRRFVLDAHDLRGHGGH